MLNRAHAIGFSVADFRAQHLRANSGTRIARNTGAGDTLEVDPGDATHGTTFIRSYSGKNITGATAGLAYNLGVGHAAITNAGVHTINVGDGNQNYDFNDRGVFGAGHNLARYTHFKCLRDDPVTDAN